MNTDLVTRLRKQSVCIYIAVEKTVADDVSDALKKAAEEIERQDLEIKAILKSVLHHFGPSETHKVTTDALAARDG